MNRSADLGAELHAWLVQVLRESGRTAREVAQATGISETSISHMRKGKRPVSDRTAVRIAQSLGIPSPVAMYVERGEEQLAGKETAGKDAPEVFSLRQELDELRRIVLRLTDRMDRITERLETVERHRRHA